ncbi:uncharacterized protein LOC134834984 [Culicoides brevitarsis]|uniref:uncharacterized protein LOC134834984 n=1 Tax=Culicoides brevitarsis TaxID=469753 RepID=UPI00307B9A40
MKMTDKSSNDKRPLSQYDNLASVSVIGTNPPVVATSTASNESNRTQDELMFKDIKFQFDDINPAKSEAPTSFNKSVISDAKSIFFGLHKPNSNGAPKDENLPLMGEQESQTPKVTTPVASKLQQDAKKETPVSSLNGSNSSNNGSSKKQITLLVDDTNDTSLSQSYLNESSSPSQAVYMSTTVPQNISKTNIGGRHKPTRSSLRHSRMLVLKNMEGSNRNIYALDIDCRLLARICYTALLVSGLLIGTICLGILLWAPNTSAKDNCFWSGIVLFICGIVVMGVTEFKAQTQANCIKENYFTFLKINCAVLLIITIFCSSLAFIYGAIHFTTLNSNEKECLPENLLIASSSCICLFGDRRNMTQDFNTMISNNNGSNGEIRNVSFNETSAGFEIHYRDLSCHEVAGIWYYVILVLLILNGLGFLAAIVFTVIFAISYRNRTRRYTSVRLNQT